MKCLKASRKEGKGSSSGLKMPENMSNGRRSPNARTYVRQQIPISLQISRNGCCIRNHWFPYYTHTTSTGNFQNFLTNRIFLLTKLAVSEGADCPSAEFLIRTRFVCSTEPGHDLVSATFLKHEILSFIGNMFCKMVIMFKN